MFPIILLILLSTHRIDAWSGILLDGLRGNTQLFVPRHPPVSYSNINFGLSHLDGQAAVMLNGNAYFTAGYSGAYTNAVTIFNPSTNSSTHGTSMNNVRAFHAATVVGDTIIVCGGNNGTVVLSSCEQYSSTTQNWSMIASLPQTTTNFAMATLNNRAYTFGGSGDCASPPVYMFDGQKWVPRSSTVGVSSFGHAGVALDADRALICGGWAYKGGECPPVSDCSIYEASSNSWTKAASMAKVRCSHSMVMFEGETMKQRCC